MAFGTAEPVPFVRFLPPESNPDSSVLGELPPVGSRDELRPGYRSFPVGQYVVFYRLSDSGIQIMHVLYGKRDLDALFES